MFVTRFALSVLFVFLIGSASAQALVADAGLRDTICPGTSLTLGGSPTATGGTGPYTFQWTPTTNLSSSTIANPLASPAVPTMYYVQVIDAVGDTAIDSVFVDLYSIWAFNAGPDTSMCINESVVIGGPNNSLAGGVTYAWSPATGLSSTTAPRPTCSVTVTTTYSLTITSPNCPSKVFEITVTVHPLPNIVATPNAATIDEGQAIAISASGGVSYVWTPPGGLSNTVGSLTNAEPTSTTTYTVVGFDQNGCVNYDTVTITVNPFDEVVLYNSFSPNNDGINDFWYIGNIQKYPDNRLEVFTRTGQQVYAKSGYDNSWDGTNYGDKLPEATYYFTLNLGNGSPPIMGSVTILR
jgi:gliding motility-associated-like protein